MNDSTLPPPPPPAPPVAGPKRPWFKRKRYMIPLGVFAFVTVVGATAGDPDVDDVQVQAIADDSTDPESEPVAAPVDDDPTPTTTAPTTTAPTTTTAAPTTTTSTVPPAIAAYEALSFSEQQAADKALSYLDFKAFSESGLIDQLEFEGFATADATAAVTFLETWDIVDWFEQAVGSAESYLDFTSFSRAGLVDQLEFEGFTAEQANHGAAAFFDQ